MPVREPVIPKHGGFKKLKTYQLAQLVYDVTVRFCDLYISRRSRTHDQMVQAARSGVRNITEGSQTSGTSRKNEMFLTGVARASLEELRQDYVDYLRHRGLPLWEPGHPGLERFKARRCSSVEEVRQWVQDERKARGTDDHGPARTTTDRSADARVSVSVRESPCSSVPSAVLVANAALSLLNVCCHLLDKQLAAQARAFEQEGGFTERLYRIRKTRRHTGP